jgi:hypothetical protein
MSKVAPWAVGYGSSIGVADDFGFGWVAKPNTVPMCNELLLQHQCSHPRAGEDPYVGGVRALSLRHQHGLAGHIPLHVLPGHLSRGGATPPPALPETSHGARAPRRPHLKRSATKRLLMPVNHPAVDVYEDAVTLLLLYLRTPCVSSTRPTGTWAVCFTVSI